MPNANIKITHYLINGEYQPIALEKDSFVLSTKEFLEGIFDHMDPEFKEKYSPRLVNAYISETPEQRAHHLFTWMLQFQITPIYRDNDFGTYYEGISLKGIQTWFLDPITMAMDLNEVDDSFDHICFSRDPLHTKETITIGIQCSC